MICPLYMAFYNKSCLIFFITDPLGRPTAKTSNGHYIHTCRPSASISKL